MSTPSTGAPQPRDTGKDENSPDPVEAVESAVYSPVQGENRPDDDSAYQPAEVDDEDMPGGD